MPEERPPRIVELAGGVGGARLAHGLQAHLSSRLTVVVNVGDDLERHGLLVCPDQDTVLYTLAGIGNAELGWGIDGETYAAAEMLERLGEESWFRLGDRDLATHVRRTKRLRDGARPTEVAGELARSLGVHATILPVSDDAVRTEVRTEDGWLEFQEYFVHRHQAPEVRDVRFRGAASATVTPEVVAAIGAADGIVVAPSNPIVSIGPIMAVPGMRASVEGARARGIRVTAVSPIVGGRALRGPADRMLASLGHESSALGVARLYVGWIDAFVIDAEDEALAPEIRALGIEAVVTDTIMVDDAARARLAAVVLDAVSAAPV